MHAQLCARLGKQKDCESYAPVLLCSGAPMLLCFLCSYALVILFSYASVGS